MMKIKKHYILYVFGLLLAGQTFSLNIKLLKGTHDILDESDVYYSPAYGLPFIECDVAKNIYDTSSQQVKRYVEFVLRKQNGAKGALITQDTAQLKHYVLNFVADRNNATQNLVAHLFNRAGVETSFLPTKVDPVQKLTIKDIGKILKIISIFEKYRPIVASIAKYQGGAELKKKQQEFLYMLQEFGLDGVSDKVGGEQNINNSWGKFKQDPGLYLQMILEESLKKHCKTIDSRAKVWNQFIMAIVESLKECFFANPNAMYVPHTTQGLLLGYMLLKVNTKQDLKEYFEGFLGKKVFVDTGDVAGGGAAASGSMQEVGVGDEEYLVDELLTTARQKPPISNPRHFAEWLCAYIYDKNYNFKLPKMTVAKNVHYDNIDFSDCVEASLLNICNIITYDTSKKN